MVIKQWFKRLYSITCRFVHTNFQLCGHQFACPPIGELVVSSCVSETDRVRISNEIKTKFQEIEQTKWLPLAKELAAEDPFQFLRAYSPGIIKNITSILLICGRLCKLSLQILGFKSPTVWTILLLDEYRLEQYLSSYPGRTGEMLLEPAK